MTQGETIDELKKPPIHNEKVALTLRVRKQNAAKIRAYARAVEAEEERTCGVDEVFPELIGKEQQVALRAYRTREGVTQQQLARMIGTDSQDGSAPILDILQTSRPS